MSLERRGIDAQINRMRLGTLRPEVHIPDLSDDEVAAALDEIRDYWLANPGWLHLPRADFGSRSAVEAVNQTALWLVETAKDLSSLPVTGEAIYDVLVNASSHVPEFGTIGGRPADEPYGCSACGCSNGANACDTWESGIALAKALLDRTGDPL